MTNPTETPPTEDELTLADAAEKFGVNLRTLQKAAERGDVLAQKKFGRYVVDAESVRLYAAIAHARTALADYIASKS